MKQKYTFINWSQFKWNKTIKHKTNKYLLKSKDNEATGILTSQDEGMRATPKLSESSEPSVGNQLRSFERTGEGGRFNYYLVPARLQFLMFRRLWHKPTNIL